MNAIQSIWTRPLFERNGSIESRFSGGWLDPVAYFASAAYSALRIKKHYKKLILVTDTLGKTIFADVLRIPYDEIDVSLDFLSEYDTSLWALGKIYACSIQQESFIHFDTDLFIWEKIPFGNKKNEIIVQNLEGGAEVYPLLVKAVLSRFPYVPPVLRSLQHQTDIPVYNTGIIGCNDPQFMQLFASEAFRFVNANHDQLRQEKNGLYNTIFEQLFLTQLAGNHGLDIRCYSPLTDLEEMDVHFKGYDNFIHAPGSVKYIHLYGNDCKMRLKYCASLLNRLKMEYPFAYERIMNFELDKILTSRNCELCL